ncbi:MAG TPA: serine/threonine-protein phosphatase [Thiothrix sp.]|nr:serine/threonine-protein phosphatase [Thiothrix sp.]
MDTQYFKQVQITHHYHSAGVTDKGCVRDHNEDAFLDLNQHAVWVVADGAGGHSSGDVASNMIVDQLATIKNKLALNEMTDEVIHCLSAVNSELIRLSGGERTKKLIASTVCVLIIRQKKCVCLWSGDSRIYLYRNKKLTALTRDHNRVDEFIAAGFSEEEAEKMPIAQQLVNAIGVQEPLNIEKCLYETKTDDVFLLCSDGLYKELTEKEIEAKLTGNMVEKNVQDLLTSTLNRGARDNTTALLVQVDEQE